MRRISSNAGPGRVFEDELGWSGYDPGSPIFPIEREAMSRMVRSHVYAHVGMTAKGYTLFLRD
jgi:hypothetical protein